ncbi:protein-associating with the carboxyl-terminal domain of ezrin [Phlebotomus argentipes]|uniref:protein-associating with the carboxyl-terminal domain of ezrin n=1 Tax=Phlebotomus argentipes TaxID=94469 RepID=UPI0028932A9A|nr:protein-associating with the carboxyl-terminal domain of ezrin [Phlebotomus argentipes]
MGSEQSLLKGLEIEEKATEVSDFWSVFAGELKTDTRTSLLTIFQGESVISTNQFWDKKNPLEKAIKNLMLFRHPSILKYVSSWERGSTKYLATERCKPLSLLIKTQNSLEICLGLRNILNALIFLVEHGKTRHLNICFSSVYITHEGVWKLSGFEYLWPSAELTRPILELSLPNRYSNAVDKRELEHSGLGIEQYGFATLCKEIFELTSQEKSSPFHEDFQQYCTNHLQHTNPSLRPELSAVLLHPYFNHDFVLIHSFLSEVPLKDSAEKQQFFTDLVDKLRTFDETDVAIHLGDFLLSRLVLLDPTAQICVTPFVLDPKCDDIVPGVFSTGTFVKFIIPKLKQVFCVHDVQIRLILLEHFHKFMSLFSEEDLTGLILPQLLLGIKDTNDILVSMTLRCLADLVAILGATVVVGKNRSRLFADGRPQRVPEAPMHHWGEPRSISPVIESAGQFSSHNMVIRDHRASFADISNENLLSERLSPDGGEAGELRDKDDDQWSDWDAENAKTPDPPAEADQDDGISAPTAQEDEIQRLDMRIMPKKKASVEEEVDFFKDMEPVIAKTQVLVIGEEVAKSGASQVSRLQANLSENATEEGWDESDWE